MPVITTGQITASLGAYTVSYNVTVEPTYATCRFDGTGLFAITVTGVINIFNPGDPVSSSKINENFQSLKSAIEATNEVPIGTIVAWHGDMNGVPALPSGWVKCDGSVINDSASPMNGETLPDLNGQRNAWNAQGSFLCGHSTSGQWLDDALQKHKHNDSGHTHDYGFREHRTNPPTYYLIGSGGFWVSPSLTQTGYANLGDPTESGTGAGTPRAENETRPVSMSVIWIMKIK